MIETTDQAADRIASARGFIFDMDGTLALGDKLSGGHVALPGAVELIDALRQKGTPFRVFTNGSAKPPPLLAASLRRAGFDVRDEEMMTPTTVAAAWLVEQGHQKVRVLGDPDVDVPVRAKGIEVVAPDAPADGVTAVYSAWFRGFGFTALEAACRDLWNGATLVTASHVPFFASKEGKAIGSSFAINVMLTALTDQPARVLGKPAREAFDYAVADMGLGREDGAHVVVVGDDPALEMRMANAAGAISVGVASGLHSLETMQALEQSERPLLALEGVGGLARFV
jgi:HAD superfamily hydrolase (TIGR01450 family)